MCTSMTRQIFELLPTHRSSWWPCCCACVHHTTTPHNPLNRVPQCCCACCATTFTKASCLQSGQNGLPCMIWVQCCQHSLHTLWQHPKVSAMCVPLSEKGSKQTGQSVS